MALKLGIHTGPQDLTMEELLKIWRRADESGFHWASVWDHFYANPLASRDNPCFEGVASMAALAGATEHLRVGCLVFCALFRSPGILAKAAVTIDHLSQGAPRSGLAPAGSKRSFVSSATISHRSASGSINSRRRCLSSIPSGATP